MNPAPICAGGLMPAGIERLSAWDSHMQFSSCFCPEKKLETF